MTGATVPKIYVRSSGDAPQVALGARFISGTIAAACLAVLIVAAVLVPSPSGVGTHVALGMAACPFLTNTGVPCPGCGLTTSFSWFARGDIEASLYVQPMGTMLAALVAAAFWGASYIAVTGRPAYRLVERIPPRYYLIYLPSFAIVAWAWKIWIHVHRLDGWH